MTEDPDWEPVGFPHERLDVHRAALEFVGIAQEIVASLPPGRRELADQLDRAALSIVLNVAEGSGEHSRREKARFYRIAGRSAAECSAILDVGLRLQAFSADHGSRGNRLLRRIGARLTVMARKHETGG